jgi:hypothetical protein
MVRMHLVRASVVAALLLSARSGLGGGDVSEQVLATARDGNRAAIQTISSMELRYEQAPLPGTTPEQASEMFIWYHWGKYWRSGDVFRHLESHDGFDWVDRDYVVRNGQMFVFRKYKPPIKPTLAVATPRPVDGTGGEVWKYLLFSHWGWRKEASYYTLDEILQHGPKVEVAERLSPGGEIHLKLSHAGARSQEFWLDPKANYLVRKCVWVPAGDTSLRWEHEVIEFAEPAKSVFVPVVIDVRKFKNGNPAGVIRTVVKDLKVNHKLPADSLRMPGAAGMNCIDLDRNEQYKADADGNPVGPKTPVKVASVTGEPLKNRGIGDNPPSPYVPGPSSREPRPWWVWVLIAAIAVTLVSGAVAVRRRIAHARGVADE